MEKTESTQHTGNARRKILSVAISQILMEKGFDSVDKECLETLTEMLQSSKHILYRLYFYGHTLIGLHYSARRGGPVGKKLLRVIRTYYTSGGRCCRRPS